ncbi:MAG: hypothetical protein ACR2QW_10010 [bacterium]
MADDPVLKTATAKKRRFLSSDYDNIADTIKNELHARRGLKERANHEVLWKEVDRQVRMEPMERIVKDPDEEWRSALELGDLSTACEVLSADVLRLIFPQDRSWLQPHIEIDMDRLRARDEIEGKKVSKKRMREIQNRADAELRALMTQQHSDFGFRARIELSVKEALKHGSFVAEILWQENQEYKMGGVFESAAAPVWIPHSMWDCYPETLELGADLLYHGSMIITSEKTPSWILRQKNFINLASFQKRIEEPENPVEIATWYGDITVKRKTEDLFLPNMRIRVAQGVVIQAEPMDNISVIYGGYDRIDVKDPYYLSPLVKSSPNHKLTTIIANRFLDNVELKLEPPLVYNGNDGQLVAQGGPRLFPGAKSPTKGGAQDFKQIDIGDPSWAIPAVQFFKAEIQEATGVSSPRAGAQRQADRVTATQIEQEAQGSEIRTIDFVGKIEKGIRAYCYIQHELNKHSLSKYRFYNPEMGMKDFDTLSKDDLPRRVHFEIVGSKGVLMERRRMEGTFQVTQFLLSSEITAGLVNGQEVAMQLYADAGNKTPEKLLNVGDENDRLQKAVAEVQAKAEEMIQEMQQELQKVGQDLVKSEQENASLVQQGKLKTERAQTTENALREEIRSLKAQMDRTADFLQDIGKIKDEKQKLEMLQKEIDHTKEKDEVSRETDSEKESTPSVVVNIEKGSGFRVKRDENGDMQEVLPLEAEGES